MYKFLIKNGQAAALLLGLLVVAIFLISAFTGMSGAGYDIGADLNKLPDAEKAAIGFFNPGLGLTVLLAALAIGLAFVIFGVVDLVKFPKTAIKFGGGLLALIVIFFILYSTADAGGTGKLPGLIDKFDISDKVSKMISGGIFTTIGLLAVAAFIMVAAEIRNAFK